MCSRKAGVSIRRAPDFVTPWLVASAAFVLAGCANVTYYSQSVAGHLALMSRARPVETVVADPETAPRLAARLRTALAIRDFASDELALPANESYRRYVDLGRRHVLWNVVAAPELSLEPRRWCFPVAGCVSYRGYFSEADAREYARALASEGWDVTVAGVGAYSTLGWFDDPLLSSMAALPEYNLAGIVFHELAHQRLYVPGDTAFNESFAVVVERAGVRRWIEAAGRTGLDERYRVAAERWAAFLDLVRDTRRDLEVAYASSRPAAEKREAKAHLIERLRTRYDALRATWEGGPTWDFWFERGVNNAAIALLSTYDRWVPALDALLARSGSDLAAFYRECDALAALAPHERRAELERLERIGHRSVPVLRDHSGSETMLRSGSTSRERAPGSAGVPPASGPKAHRCVQAGRMPAIPGKAPSRAAVPGSAGVPPAPAGGRQWTTRRRPADVQTHE